MPEHGYPASGKSADGVGAVIAEGARNLVADDIPQHAAESSQPRHNTDAYGIQAFAGALNDAR